MEFTVRVTERDYAAADSLMWRKTATHVIVFSLYLAATIIVWAALGLDLFRLSSHSLEPSASAALRRSTIGLTSSALWLAFGYVLFKAIRYIRQKLEYRKNTNLHRDISWNATAEGITVTSESGATSYEPWAVFKCWRETKRLFLLLFPSNVYYIIPKPSLGPTQQNELRSILGGALPRK